MKIDGSHAAVRYWVMKRADDHFCDPAVPDDYGPVHAVITMRRLPRPAERGPIFMESWNAPTTVCGIKARVIFPSRFDTEEQDACDRCLALLQLREKSYAEYVEAIRRIDLRRYESPDPEAQQIRDDLATFYDRQARSLGDVVESPRLTDIDDTETA